MYFRAHFTVGPGTPQARSGLRDIEAPDISAAATHVRYIAVEPERKALAMERYGDKRQQIARPDLVKAEELPEVEIRELIPLRKIGNRFEEETSTRPE